MEKNLFYDSSDSYTRHLWLVPGILSAVGFGWLIAGQGVAIAAMLVALPLVVGFLIMVFLKPRFGMVAFILYCFFMPTIGRHAAGLQVGLGIDALLILIWLGILFYRNRKYRFKHLNNDLCWLALSWFILTVLEMANPARPDVVGWLQEMRSIALYGVLLVPLTFLVFNKRSDITFFLDVIILVSFLGAIYGMKQLYIGLDGAEQQWLNDGHLKTHMLFGKLRVFSFFAEAGQFGASQAQLAMMTVVLAIGPYSTARKICYSIAALFIFYGMLLSGTRGALGGIIGGGFVYLVLSKQVKIIIAGGIIGAALLGMLKFTSIGSGNDQIKRIRSGMDPNDPSLMVRLVNQRILSDMLASKPFGTGVGTIGMWGVKYNKHISTSKIPPDSLYVKVWAMYGIIGFIFWLGMMLYILGKSAGIIWNTRDPVLRNQLCSLCAGFGSVMMCSYGNEVMNVLPTTAIVYISWSLIWMSTRWDTPLLKPATL